MVTSPRRHSSSSLAPHRRSAIADRSAPLPLLRCSVLGALPRPSLKIFLSFSLFFSHWNEKNENMIWNFCRRPQIVDRHRRSALPLLRCSGAHCRLLPPAVRPSTLKVFLPDSLSQSLSLSISLKYWMKKWKVIYERFSLYSLTLITIWSHISVSLSLFWTASYWLAFTFFFFFFFLFCLFLIWHYLFPFCWSVCWSFFFFC